MKHETHTQHIMKDTDSFYVRLCNCGVVHLCFGATTLNLTQQAVIAVSETLKQVSQEIRAKNQSSTGIDDAIRPIATQNVIQLDFTNQQREN